MRPRQCIRTLAVLAVLTGCGSEQQLESNRRFYSVTYQDTTWETFSRTNREITGELRNDSGDTVRFRIRTTGDAEVKGVDYTLHPATSRGQPLMTQRVGMPENTIPVMQNSVAFIEQLLRRARARGGDRVTIPVLLVGAESSTESLTLVRRGPDSVLILDSSGDARNAVHLAVDSAGHVLGGSIPLSGTRIVSE